MRILHIASGDIWAGAEVQLYTLLRELRSFTEYTLVAAIMNEGELASRLSSCGVETHTFNETTESAYALLDRLIRLMRAVRPTIIHTHRIKENLLGLIANAATAKARTVRTVHGNQETPSTWTHPLRKGKFAVDRWTGRYMTDAVIAVSQSMAEELSRSGYRNIHYIPNGVDLDQVLSAQRTAEFRATHPHTLHVGFVGRLVPVKRPDVFLTVARELRRRSIGRRIMFHVLGDGPLREVLESSVRHEVEEERWIVFHGHRTDAPNILGSFHAIVLCSDHEGLPMVLLEAIAAGTPVVAHAVGGISEVMQKVSGGVALRSQDPIAIADTLERLLSGSMAVDRELAREGLSRHYSSRANARAVRSLYELLASP